jgi:hypothetical protein
VVTHLTTSPPVTSLSTAERTGSAIFLNLWSYVKDMGKIWIYVKLGTVSGAVYRASTVYLPSRGVNFN